MAIAFNSSYGLPEASDGTVQNAALSGGLQMSNSLHRNDDGTLATAAKAGGAFVNSSGWLVNANGSLAVAAKQAGASWQVTEHY